MMEPYYPMSICPDCGQLRDADDDFYEIEIDPNNIAAVPYTCDECGITWMQKWKIEFSAVGGAYDKERHDVLDYDDDDD